MLMKIPVMMMAVAAVVAMTIRTLTAVPVMTMTDSVLLSSDQCCLTTKFTSLRLHSGLSSQYTINRHGVPIFYFQSSLHYYAALNAMQYKRKCSLLEPFLGYMQAQKAFFSMGRESLEKPEVDEFLSNINASIQE